MTEGAGSWQGAVLRRHQQHHADGAVLLRGLGFGFCLVSLVWSGMLVRFPIWVEEGIGPYSRPDLRRPHQVTTVLRGSFAEADVGRLQWVHSAKLAATVLFTGLLFRFHVSLGERGLPFRGVCQVYRAPFNNPSCPNRRMMQA